MNLFASGIAGFLGPLFIYVVEIIGSGDAFSSFPFLIVYSFGSCLAFLSIIICAFTDEEKFKYE